MWLDFELLECNSAQNQQNIASLNHCLRFWRWNLLQVYMMLNRPCAVSALIRGLTGRSFWVCFQFDSRRVCLGRFKHWHWKIELPNSNFESWFEQCRLWELARPLLFQRKYVGCDRGICAFEQWYMPYNASRHCNRQSLRYNGVASLTFHECLLLPCRMLYLLGSHLIQEFCPVFNSIRLGSHQVVTLSLIANWK